MECKICGRERRSDMFTRRINGVRGKVFICDDCGISDIDYKQVEDVVKDLIGEEIDEKLETLTVDTTVSWRI